MTSTTATERDPGADAARRRVAALFERAARVNLSVVVVAPPDTTRESARDVATSAAVEAGRGALLREATAAAREISIATQQQRSASDQVVVAMTHVSDASRMYAEGSRVGARAASELAELAGTMQESIASFVVEERP